LNFGIWIRDDGWSRPGGTYRIKITIRFKVRRSERFVEKKGPTKRFRGWVYSKKAGVLSIDFSLNYFSLDRGIIGCPPFPSLDRGIIGCPLFPHDRD
jgi:hypothetical protein